ncbi:MAG: SAM-dependent methyltransferase [Clostridia bacterium]|nr:SAM-dependent methyltransferase [Clostridia bacterium]
MSVRRNTLGERLETAIPYVRQGDRVIDVGTDHAYLPIALVQREIASAVLATDVRPGPLEMALANIAALGLERRIALKQNDGLAGLEWFSPDTVLLFGMGGELIVEILDKAPFVKQPPVRLVLQPMTHAEILRSWLSRSGFSFLGETISRERGKYYQTICAAYTGECRELSTADAYLGPVNRRIRGELFESFRIYTAGQKKKILEACKKAGPKGQAEAGQVQSILDALEQG